MRGFETALLVVLLALAPPGVLSQTGGAETKFPVPRALAPLLEKAQEHLRAERPVEAIKLLESYRGTDDHALRHVLLGHAFYRQERPAPAAAAYRRALELDPGSPGARRALAQILAQQEQWPAAVEMLASVVDVRTSGADWIALYAQAALRAEDSRLARLLVTAGMTRFPGDPRFRKLDVALLTRENRPARAREGLMTLLQADAADAILWSRWASLATDDVPASRRLAAFEAAVLCAPDDLDRHRQFLVALLMAGSAGSAVEHGQTLLAGPLAAAAGEDVDLVELLVRAADAAESSALVRQWTELIPAQKRSRTIQIALARAGLREAEPDRAHEALRRLIALGESDMSIYLWAGRLAEAAGAVAAAQAYYEQARQQDETASGMADLHLARLHIGAGRGGLAAQVLRRYLAAHPEDAYGRALLQVAAPAGFPD